jgi:hypothetical protein
VLFSLLQTISLYRTIPRTIMALTKKQPAAFSPFFFVFEFFSQPNQNRAQELAGQQQPFHEIRVKQSDRAEFHHLDFCPVFFFRNGRQRDLGNRRNAPGSFHLVGDLIHIETGCLSSRSTEIFREQKPHSCHVNLRNGADIGSCITHTSNLLCWKTLVNLHNSTQSSD